VSLSSKTLSILALTATVCMLILLGVQISEVRYYDVAPSIWPSAK